MSNASTATASIDPYRVKPGDTLSAIARRCGRSIAELQHLNRLPDPNKLQVGQVLYLSEASAFGVSVLFLDALRHPIQNLPFRVQFDGKVVAGISGPQGTVPRQVTQSASSRIEVWIQNAEKRWERVTQVASDYGHKLITLISPALVIPGQTEPHPSGAPIKPQASKPRKRPRPKVQQVRPRPKLHCPSQPAAPPPRTIRPSRPRRSKGHKGNRW